VPWITARVDEQLQCSNDLLSLITGPPEKKKGKKREGGERQRENERKRRRKNVKENAKDEASSEIFREFSSLTLMCYCLPRLTPEQMLNGLIDRQSQSGGLGER